MQYWNRSERRNGIAWNRFFWLRIGISRNNSKPSGSTECGESDQPRSFSRTNGLCGLSELVTARNMFWQHACAHAHIHTNTYSMQQLVILVQHNTSMHRDALHSHNMNHFMSWTLHGQHYKATLFWHLITVPWTCTRLTPAFTLMWCHSACTPNPQALQNGQVIQHTWKQQAHTTWHEHKSGAFRNVMQCTLVKSSKNLKEPAPSIIRTVGYTEGGGSRFF
jgi:hypothetical protein